MAVKNFGRVFVGAGVTLGLMSIPSLVRYLDRRREIREGACDQPSILDGEEKKGVHSIDGTTLYVDYLGEKDPTVFLVHGFACCTQAFRYQKPFLSDKYRVVGIDLRGHGRSEVPKNRGYHVERFAEDLKAVVDVFEPEQFVIAGFSLGGLAAFKFFERFAKDYEGRLRGLAIIDSTGGDITDMSLQWKLLKKWNQNLMDNVLGKAIADMMSDSSLMYAFIRSGMFGKRPLASEIEFIQRITCSTPIATLKGTMKDNDDYRFEHYLPNVDIPVMLIVGSEDSLMANDRKNKRTYSLLPDARLKVLEGAGHLALLERPEELNEALDGFLTEVFGKG